MELKFFIMFTAIILFIFTPAKGAETMKNNLILKVKLAEGKILNHSEGIDLIMSRHIYPNDSIPLSLSFTNKGKDSIRLLKHFRPIPIFFSFTVTKSDGTIIDLPGGGKISLINVEYTELNSNKNFIFDVNLKEILIEPLNVGRYTLSVEYHNQYGNNCFTGYLQSNTVHFEIIGENNYNKLLKKGSF